jgi:hypothetical protein
LFQDAAVCCNPVGIDLVGEMSSGPWKGYTYGGASLAAGASGTVISLLKDRDVDMQAVDIQLSGLLAKSARTEE